MPDEHPPLPDDGPLAGSASGPGQQGAPGGGGRVNIYAPVMRFFVMFALSLGILLWISFSKVFETRILAPWLALNADLSAKILGLLGFGTRAEGQRLFSPEFSLEVSQGCDGFAAWALFISTVLAFPAGGRAKVLGLLAGTAFLFAMNLVRVVTLFWIGVIRTDLFETFHVDVWQPAFILVSVLLFIVWAMKVTVPSARSSTQGG